MGKKNTITTLNDRRHIAHFQFENRFSTVQMLKFNHIQHFTCQNPTGRNKCCNRKKESTARDNATNHQQKNHISQQNKYAMDKLNN